MDISFENKHYWEESSFVEHCEESSFVEHCEVSSFVEHSEERSFVEHYGPSFFCRIILLWIKLFCRRYNCGIFFY